MSDWPQLSVLGTSSSLRRKMQRLLQFRPRWPVSSLCLLPRRPPHLQTSTTASWAPRTSCLSRSPTTAWPPNRTLRTWPQRSTKSPLPWRRPPCSRWAATRTGGRKPAAIRSRRTDTWGPTPAATAPPAGRSAFLTSKMAAQTSCCCARTEGSARRTNADWVKAAERAAEPEQTTCLFNDALDHLTAAQSVQSATQKSLLVF